MCVSARVCVRVCARRESAHAGTSVFHTHPCVDDILSTQPLAREESFFVVGREKGGRKKKNKRDKQAPETEAMDLSKLGDLLRKTQSAIVEKELLIKRMDDIQAVSAFSDSSSASISLQQSGKKKQTLGGITHICGGLLALTLNEGVTFLGVIFLSV